MFLHNWSADISVIDAVYEELIVLFHLPNRKKKKELTHQVSIYNPNGSGFLPGHNGFPKTREDNESHVYASIEDTLVYTHLLRKGVEIGIYGELDTSRPFTGHTDSQKPLISEDAGVADVQVGPNQQFRDSSIEAPPLPERPPSHGQQLMDNEIYQTEDQHGEERCLDLGLRLEPEGGN